ncbi:MAG: DNA polymerase III subunit alpha [SAR202 cluster bacterium]|nr:DNA polymerase III subunit alpha [SAR202 cluster bacterium]
MFSHLHTHTEYSMLDGLSRLEPLVARAAELGMNSLAITDHGGMYGAIDFYKIAKAAGIKPIIGCEMYVAPSSRHERNPKEKSPYHMTVLAKSNRGYQNLIKLVTMSHLEGFYYRPRVDREILEQHSEGLIVMSGCPSGEVPSLILQGRMDEARATAGWYKEVFDDYYLEFMEHGDVPELPAINQGLMQLRTELDLPVVATNDSHYVVKEAAHLQDILICIHTNTNVNDAKRMRMEESSYYLKSPEEMMALYPHMPEAVTNTQLVADMCDVEFDFTKQRLPEYAVPDGTTATEFLAKLCWDGFKTLLPDADETYVERLKYELEVIKQTRFDNYFLVVWDISKFVRRRDIFFAVRGSAAASLVLYCLGVTDVNPMPYTLVFERFLNLERKEMPDIDMDFQDDRREEVINYCIDKYGRDHVAQIITFGTMGAKGVLRDVGRALAMPYGEVDQVARMIPTKLGVTLEEAKELNPEFQQAIDSDETVKKLVETAEGLEGLTRHSSTHAAAVVISEEPLTDVVPLQRPSKNDENSVFTTTQYAMDPVAALGLLKMDFLGLVNLTVLAKARDLIAEHQGITFALNDIPLDDRNTYDLLARGETVGVFQMEGGGMTRNLKELKPTSLGDVAAMIALYRPGPMEHIGTFIDAKHGRTLPSYPHPALEEILEETYGVIVYQDQVLHLFRTFAGYSLGEADIVRKAMGKKIPAIMAQEKEKFLSGGRELGFDQSLAEQIFTLIEPFAGYAFNKAHSVSYGLISYWTAYLKANYPAEYMVALLNAYMGSSDRTISAVVDCQRMNIPVRLPNINTGGTDFTIRKQDGGSPEIIFGMAAIKGVGPGAIEPILESREEEGPFESIEQMCRAADLSGLKKNNLESLIKAGAFDDFGDRGALLSVAERILSLAHSEAGLRESDQTSMFDLFGDSVPTPLANITLPDDKASDSETEEWERELLGLSLSGTNHLAALLRSAGSDTIISKSDIGQHLSGKKISIVGQVSTVIQRFTRKNKPFMIATVSLMDGTIDVFVWEDKMEATQGLWEEGKLVAVAGAVRFRDDEVSMSCQDAEEYSPEDVENSSSNNSNETEETPVTESSQPEQNGTGTPAPDIKPPIEIVENGANGSNGNGESSSGPGLAHSKLAVPQRLNLRIVESDSVADDQLMLDDIKRLLLEFVGEDEVSLEIAAQGQVFKLEWSMVKVNASEDLTVRLQDLLGDSGDVTVETLVN